MKEEKVPDDLLVISCEEDYSICIPLLEKGNFFLFFTCLFQTVLLDKRFSQKANISSFMWIQHSGAGVFSSELLLNGIVIQKLEYERLVLHHLYFFITHS